MLKPILFAIVVFAAGIGCGMPHDPEGTLERVRHGTMRVGITENEPWTRDVDEHLAGIEVDLVEDFARSLDARIRWTRGSESELLDTLHRRKLDVVIGGLVKSTPWSKKIGLTQPYVEFGQDKHVLAVAPGENAWVLRLDRYLQDHRRQIRQRCEQEVVQ